MMRNQKWDGTDVSADLSSEALGEGGGHPSLRNDIDFGGLQSLAAAEPIKAHHRTHALLRQNKALIAQHGAEGPAPSRS